ncbi:MAG: selenide, water dikinase SelD [Alphaproteobacteria bacterium]|nr:selenide, water dikinase SelD [Alphaproteobacteria bacterium]
MAEAVRDLVLVGGGHAHVHVLKSFGMQPIPGVRLSLVAREIETPYSGMLPGYVAGHYSLDECHIDLAPLARFARARLISAEAIGLDRDRRQVSLAGRPGLRFDVVSLNVGATPSLSVPGAAEHAIPVKPIHRFAPRWEALRARVEASPRPVAIKVVGGGAGGVELALAIRHRLGDQATVELVTRGRLLAGHAARAAVLLRRALAERDVACREEAEVAAVEPRTLVLADGERLAADEVLWVTEAAAPAWLATTGLRLDRQGFLAIADTLCSVDDAKVFAAGDAAAMLAHARPKAGVFAVRQGPPLAENLRRALSGRRLKPFAPQRAFLSLIGTGDRRAVASRGALALEGAWLWRLKETIDRRWMLGYAELPAMAPLSMPTPAEMRCGGCGAKVGATALSRALARLPRRPPRDGVLLGLADRDDAAAIAVPAGRVLLQSTDFFRSLVDDPYLFGRIAAIHALGDLHAKGAEPHSALAVAVIPHAAPEIVEEDLAQMLAGAESALTEAGAALIGGHSSEGNELAFGLTVNGTSAPEAIVRKGGARPGDALVLTKPLGTGVLFAAAMQGRARGRWLAAAIASMTRSLAPAARILGAEGALAMTDVTGFGLIGHAFEMAIAGDVGFRLEPGAVPALAGALELLDQGFASTLAPENRRARCALAEDGGWAGTPELDLLFDPQTAGGLLAALPADRAEASLAALRAVGETASVIGTVTAPADGVRPLRLAPRLSHR